VPEQLLLDHTTQAEEGIGIGDLCYAVGLFQVLAGKKRNLPVVHSGNIALMPGQEQIPVRDWRNPTRRSTILSDGFLVELANLPGLSGAPVFVRPTCMDMDWRPLLEGEPHETPARMVRSSVQLLGIWSGSWDGREIGVSRAQPNDLRVPVGMGIVTPVNRLLALLESANVAEQRDRFLQWQRARAAVQPDITDSV
jgi:hypothetical protein